MNKISIIIVLISLLVVACQTKNNEVKETNINKSLVQKKNSPEVEHFLKMEKESGLLELSSNPKKHTWQEVDALYQSLPKKYSGQDLKVLQGITVSLLLESKALRGYGLTQETSKEAEEKFLYYAQEFERLQIASMPVALEVIKKLQQGKQWETARINHLKNNLIKTYEKEHPAGDTNLEKLKAL
jgi:hypothetical protein